MMKILTAARDDGGEGGAAKKDEPQEQNTNANLIPKDK
jgi:hypothetical protein